MQVNKEPIASSSLPARRRHKAYGYGWLLRGGRMIDDCANNVVDLTTADTVKTDELIHVTVDVASDLSSATNTNNNTRSDFLSEPLLKYLNTDQQPNQYFDVQKAIHALRTDGYYHIPSVLTKEECIHGIEQMWDFVHDVSAGCVVRDNPTTWYPNNQLETNRMNAVQNEQSQSQTNDSEDKEDTDPWPHTGYSSFPDMFQSLGAGFVLGKMRELLAERVFEPLFGTRELISSKEGFTFHRPLVISTNDEQQLVWNPYQSESSQSNTVHGESENEPTRMKPIFKVCGMPQPLSEGQHYDQGVPMSVMNHINGKENNEDSTSNGHFNKKKFNKHQKIRDLTGLCHIQASVSFTDQTVDKDCGGGHFLCYPRSHSMVHQRLIGGTYRATPSDAEKDRAWVPLTDEEIQKLKEFGCQEKRIYANKGDVILWRSDLAHAAVAPTLIMPTSDTQRPYDGPKEFRAVGYCSMMPLDAIKDYAYYSLPRRKIKNSTSSLKIIQDEMDNEKLEAYRTCRTGDHRPDVESWHDHRRATMWNSSGNGSSTIPSFLQRPKFRLGPPELTVRQAELYGIIPYKSQRDGTKKLHRIDRAIIRGVRFETGMENEVDVEESKATPSDACTARLEFLTSNLVGQDKYLGGMASPCGRYIYGVPGHAKRVIRVTIQTGEVDWIGPEYIGEFKWLRGVEIPAYDDHPGCCLALPCNSKSGCVLKIDPETSSVNTFITNELDFGDGWLYHGGNLASDGYVYAVPASARRVMKIHPIKETTEYIGPDFEGKAKWYGGIVGSDGCIYGIPHNANGVLKIDPSTQEVSILAEGTLPQGQWKWHGGLASADCGKIIGFPNNAESILVIDVTKQRVYLIGDESILRSGTHRVPRDGRYKYLGGALTADGLYAYLFPCDAEYVLRIDMVTDELKLVGPRMTEGENKFQNGFVGRDGCIYGIPQRSCGVLRIVPPGVKRYNFQGEELSNDKEIVDVMYCGDDMISCKDKFEGGVLGLDGSIYCIPLRAKSFVKVVPGLDLNATSS